MLRPSRPVSRLALCSCRNDQPCSTDRVRCVVSLPVRLAGKVIGSARIVGRAVASAGRSMCRIAFTMEHEHTQHIAATPDRVFAVLGDISRLPEFVPQMTGAHAGDGDSVVVDARYEGHTQHGEAWFRPD